MATAMMARLLMLAVLPAASAVSAAAEVEVDLELVLAVDVSRSMDVDEQRLQRRGYVDAFRHAEVIRAIGRGEFGRIAVTYFEWAGRGTQTPIVPWTLIAGRRDAEAFAAALAAAPLTQQGGTSISSAFFYAGGRFDNGFRGTRLAVDVSGDGPNNSGMPVDQIRDWLIARGVTINGLPIMVKRNYSYGPIEIDNLDVYYEDCVIGGPGAFMITVDDIRRFRTAIRRKLVLEIAGLPPHLMLAAEGGQKEARVDCQVGEKARRAWIWRDR
jgi:hypothetical protein